MEFGILRFSNFCSVLIVVYVDCLSWWYRFCNFSVWELEFEFEVDDLGMLVVVYCCRRDGYVVMVMSFLEFVIVLWSGLLGNCEGYESW